MEFAPGYAQQQPRPIDCAAVAAQPSPKSRQTEHHPDTLNTTDPAGHRPDRFIPPHPHRQCRHRAHAECRSTIPQRERHRYLSAPEVAALAAACKDQGEIVTILA